MARSALIVLILLFTQAVLKAQIILPYDSASGKIVYDTIIVVTDWTGKDTLLENYFRERFSDAVYKSPKVTSDSIAFNLYGWKNFSYAKKIGSKSRCWMRIEGHAVGDSLRLSVTDIAHQDFPDAETRDPGKSKLETVYHKYIARWNKKHHSMGVTYFLAAVDEEMLNLLQELSVLLTVSSE